MAGAPPGAAGGWRRSRRGALSLWLSLCEGMLIASVVSVSLLAGRFQPPAARGARDQS